MKKILLLTVIAILLTALTSCDPEPIPGPPPVTYTISTVISGKGLVTPEKLSGVNLGSSVTLKLIPESGYSLYSVKLNGVKVEGLHPSETETTYTISNVNKNVLVDVVFVETNILTFSVKSTDEKPWYLTTVNVHKASDGSFVRSVSLYPQEKTDRYYFLYPSMKVVVFEEDGGVREGTWDLKQTTLTIDGHNYPLWELTSNKFSYQSETVWGNFEQSDIFYVLIFERK